MSLVATYGFGAGTGQKLTPSWGYGDGGVAVISPATYCPSETEFSNYTLDDITVALFDLNETLKQINYAPTDTILALIATAELLRVEYEVSEIPGAVMVVSDQLSDVGVSVSEDAVIYNIGEDPIASMVVSDVPSNVEYTTSETVTEMTPDDESGDDC